MGFYYPPTSRLPTSWAPNTVTGVVGGIPSRAGGNVINVATYGWSDTASGATNSAAYYAALAASSPGDIISIPAGTFATNGLGLDRTKPNRTVRGAGKNLTILRNTGSSSAFSIGGDTNYGNSYNPQSTITAMTRGSSTITVANGALAYDGGRRIARLYLANEQATPVVSVMGFAATRQPTVLITGRSGNDLTLSQPLPSNFAAAMAAGTCRIEIAFQLPWETVGCGVEDLTLDAVNATAVFTTRISFAENCWFKNVKIVNPGNYALFAVDSINCEIRHSDILGAGVGSNHAGLLMNGVSYFLVEDNIITGNPNIEVNFSTMNSTIAFNYFAGVVNGNHGPHNSYNLYEGNTADFFQSDGYFGGASEETLARNWFRSFVSASLKRFSRNYNYLGNLVGIVGQTYTTDYSQRWGDPNIGNESSVGTARPSTGNWWPDWDSANNRVTTLNGTLTTRTSNTSGVITLASGGGATLAALNTANGATVRQGSGHIFITITNITGDVVTFNTGSHTSPAQGSAVSITPGPSGFQQQDLDVLLTTIRKANWYVLTGNIPSAEALPSGDTLPDSYFRDAAPDWWGDRPWPAYDSAAPGTPADTNIPAGYRFVNGDEPPSGTTAAQPSFSPAAATFEAPQSVAITSATVGASIYYTLDGSTPDDTDTLYTGPITVGATLTLKAIAYKAGLTPSLVRTGAYVLQATQPAFSPAPATFSAAQAVTITTPTAGAAIRYTTDGSTPNAGSAFYSGPITLGATATLRALALKAGLDDSTVRSGLYTITVTAPASGLGFPANPSAGDSATAAGQRWIFNGKGWRRA